MTEIELQLKVIHRYAYQNLPKRITRFVVVRNVFEDGFFIGTNVELSAPEKYTVCRIEKYLNCPLYCFDSMDRVCRTFNFVPTHLIYGMTAGDYDPYAIIWNPRNAGQHMRRWARKK